MADKAYRFEHANGGDLHSIAGPWRVSGPGVKGLTFMDREVAAVVAKTLNVAYDRAVSGVFSQLHRISSEEENKIIDRLGIRGAFFWNCNREPEHDGEFRGCGYVNAANLQNCGNCGQLRSIAFDRTRIA